MGYSEKPKGKSRGPSLHDYASVIEKLEARQNARKDKELWPKICEDSNDNPHLEELSGLRDAVDDLHQILARTCEVIEHAVDLLYENLYLTQFPEPLYEGGAPVQGELSTNGLLGFRFGGESTDVPF